MMRILIVGPSAPGAMGWFLARAFKRVGVDVSVFNDRVFLQHGISGNIGKCLRYFNLYLPASPRYRSLTQRLMRMGRSFSLVIFIKGENYEPDFIRELGKCVPTLNWHPDCPVFEQRFQSYKEFHYFCPKSRWTLERLSALGFHNVIHLPHASAPDLLGHRCVEMEAKTDVSILGNVYPYRMEWIQGLIDCGATISVFGSKKINHLAKEPGVSWQESQSVGAQQGIAFRRGRATLNTHHPFDVTGGNQRVFDAAASCVPQIAELLPETMEYLDPWEHYIPIGGVKDFGSIFDYIKENPSRVAKMVQKAYQVICQKHTYEHRAIEILKISGIK